MRSKTHPNILIRKISMNFILPKGTLSISSSKLTSFCNVFLKKNYALSVSRMCSKSSAGPISPFIVEVQENLSADQLRRRAEENVDWLPYDWKRRPFHNPFEDSGDLVKELEYDPSWPKPDFELSEELKTANDDVKYMFSLATASKGEIKAVVKRKMLERIQRHPTDRESLEVKIGIQTLVVRSLFMHQAYMRKDRKGGRKVLYILINRRNKKLKQLRLIDMERFNWLCEELKLTYTPKQLGGTYEWYCRKWDLRRLTKEFCANMVKEKKNAYHQELKLQQQDFVKEKEEILAWIKKEEKEIANIDEELAKLSVDK